MIGSFPYAFARVIDIEKGLSLDENDPGNWTGGRKGVGFLKGTKYGISAKTYPNENIKELTLDRAEFLYKRDFWDKIKGDQLPDPLSYFVFDAAVNHGESAAIRMMQVALKVEADGIVGHNTLKASKSANNEVCAVFFANRCFRYMGDPNFNLYGRGWFKRAFIVAMGGGSP